jgi:hypothetical protein
MSNCYDHSIKKNMLDSVYGSKKELKDNLKENRRNLATWYYNEQTKYDRALANFDDWYKEYAGDSWEELNDNQD